MSEMPIDPTMPNLDDVGLAPERMQLDAIPPRPANLLDIIAQVVMDKNIDVAKMERLLAMQQQIIADERKIAFKAALTALQGEIPQIERDGRVIVKNVERSRYAKYETIDEYVRPLLDKHGFAIDFDEIESSGNIRKFSATLSHRGGHESTKYKTLPFDQSEYRSGAQSEVSTLSYARRTLLTMHLNIVTRDEDTDGVSFEKISADQVKDLEALIDEVKANKARFLTFMDVAELQDILKRDIRKAINALESKRRASVK